VCFLVLVNNTPIVFFSSSRCLSQGDLLSSLLFVIVMETLGRMIFASVSEGLLAGFSMGTRNVGGIDIFLLLFVDDTLIFYRVDLDNLRHLQCLFLCFEAVSSLKINLAKSELVPVENIDNVDGLSSILGCGVSSLPLKYIGLPLGASYKPKHIWDGVIKKIERRLAC